jgi:hypothetical protein
MNYFLIKTEKHVSEYYGEDELNKYSGLVNQFNGF